MSRMLSVLVFVGVLMGGIGCDSTPPAPTGKELLEAQQKNEELANQEEREMQKDQRKTK